VSAENMRDSRSTKASRLFDDGMCQTRIKAPATQASAGITAVPLAAIARHRRCLSAFD
jgi:hypothetical protein